MKSSNNGVIGVGTWVESSYVAGRFYRLDTSDLWSWFLYPVLTLREFFDELL